MKCPKCDKEVLFGDDFDMQEGSDNNIHILFECEEDADGCGHKGFWVIGFDGMLVS